MKKYILISIFSIIGFTSYSQEQLELEDVEVLKVFEAKLADAKMIQLEQALPDVSQEKPNYQYNVSAIPLELTYPEPVIRPIAMKKELLGDHKNGHVMIGGGYPKALYGDIGYNYHYADLYDFNVGARYLSLNNNKKLTDQKFLNWGIDIDGKYHMNERNTVMGKIGFDAEDVYFYNSHNSDPTWKTPRRIYNTDIYARYGNDQFNERNFTYFVGTGLDIMSLKDESVSETHVPVDLGFNYKLNSHLSFNIDTKISLNFLNNTIPSEIHSLHVIPSAKYKQPKYSISGGVDLITNSDDNTMLFPRINVSYELWKDYVVLDAGVQSNHHDNNLHNLLDYNPYLSVLGIEISGNIQKKYFVGFSGKVAKIKYNIVGGYQTDQNKALFGHVYRTTMFSDSMNTSFIVFNFSYSVLKNITFGTRNSFNRYKLNYAQAAFGLPTSENEVFVKYRALKNKLNIKTSLIIESGIRRYEPAGFEPKLVKVRPLYGVTLTAEYDITKNIGTFVNIDNVTTRKYERWYGYQQAPFNIIGGVKWKF